jgi:hypothetical protein
MFTYSVDPSKATDAIQQKLSRITVAMRDTINRCDIDLQAYIVNNKLSGDPLQQRRGGRGLAGSIRAMPAEIEGETVSGEVQGAGGVAWYGKLHEYGGTFDVPDGRRVALGSKLDRRKLMVNASKYGYDAVTHTQSRPYTITFQERSFMRSSMSENKDQIYSQMRETLMGVMES